MLNMKIRAPYYLVFFGVMVFPCLVFGECRVIGHELNYTDDFYISASSAEGVSEDVITIDLSLTIEKPNGSYLAGVILVASFDPQVVEILGEPVYSDSFWEFGFAQFFTILPESQGLGGFLLGWSVGKEPDKFLGAPIHIGTVYFRLHGQEGDASEAKNVSHAKTRRASGTHPKHQQPVQFAGNRQESRLQG